MRTIIRNNYDPKNGDYHEAIIIDDERNKKYVFDCDGVFTDFTNPRVVSTRGNSEDFAASQKWVTEIDDKVDGLAEDLGDEIQARTDADDAIWAEIEEIEMSSDVVDIVGTYAELQQYDTSKLHDKDIIKVLRDETHQNETAYYRFSTSTSTFSYVGSEGPYYTESEVDTLLAGKQDTLIAGSNIQIAADGKTISATDTTYTHFTGATASTDGVQGLVPGPLAGDQNKVLKGDGTWGDITASTVYYVASYPDNTASDLPLTLFADKGLTTPVNGEAVATAFNRGDDIYVAYTAHSSFTEDVTTYFHAIYSEVPDDPTDYESFDENGLFFTIVSRDMSLSWTISTYSNVATTNGFKLDAHRQQNLTAGNNINITPQGVISATDTTYTAGTGIAITNNQIKALSVINVTLDSPSAGYAVLRSGTTVLDTMNVHNYIDRFGADVILAVTGNNEYATLIGELPADADGIHYLFEYGHLVYDFAVGLNGTKYTITDTQAAMTGATSSTAGAKGLVPLPQAGDDAKFLAGDGTWKTVSVSPNNISSADWSALWQ